MTIQAKDFVFNGVSLSSFTTDYMLVSFDTSADENDVSIIQTSISHTDLSASSPIVHFYNRTPQDVLSFSISVCREDGQYLSQENVKELQEWLFAPKVPKVAYFLPYDDNSKAVYEDIEFIGTFASSSYEEIGQVNKAGISFSFTNIAPYAFTQIYSYDIDSSSGSGSVKIENMGTHVGETIYPQITITPAEDGTVTITNSTDTSVEPLSINVTANAPVIIKDRNLYLQDGSLYSFNNLNNFNWVAILDGMNEINVTGKCTVNIQTRFFENVGV